MSFIQSNQELARHPKTKRLARKLGVLVPTAIGHLHLLWWWALDYAQDGDLTSYDNTEIADAMMWDGEPDQLMTALIESGFIDDYSPNDPMSVERVGLFIHDWDEYTGKLIERRVHNKEQMRAAREKNTHKTRVKIDNKDNKTHVNDDHYEQEKRDKHVLNTCRPIVEYSRVENNTPLTPLLGGCDPGSQESVPSDDSDQVPVTPSNDAKNAQGELELTGDEAKSTSKRGERKAIAYTPDFEAFMERYRVATGHETLGAIGPKAPAFAYWQKMSESDRRLAFDCLEWAPKSGNWPREPRFAPYARTWLADCCWTLFPKPKEALSNSAQSAPPQRPINFVAPESRVPPMLRDRAPCDGMIWKFFERNGSNDDDFACRKWLLKRIETECSDDEKSIFFARFGAVATAIGAGAAQ